MQFLDFLEFTLGNQYLLLGITACSFLLKIGIFARLILQKNISHTSKKPWYLLLLVLFSAAIIDIAWITELIHALIMPNMLYPVRLFIIRLAWGFTAVLYQTLSIFIENLTEQKEVFNTRQKLSIFITGCFFILAIILAFYDIHCPDMRSRPDIEITALMVAMRSVRWKQNRFPSPATSTPRRPKVAAGAARSPRRSPLLTR